MDFLETQAWIGRIGLKVPVSITSLLLDLPGKVLESLTETRRDVRIHSCSGSSCFVRPFRCSLSAASANSANWSSERAKASSHRRSDSNSASNHLASLSCSFFGNLTASAKAFSRSLVIATEFTSICRRAADKIEDHRSQPGFINTVPRFGYRLDG